MRAIKSIVWGLLAASAIFVVGVSAQHKPAAPCNELTFAAPTYVAGGLGPRGLTSADLNGDGNADLVAANEVSGTVTIQFGDGNGNFPMSQQFSATGASSAAIADLNHDGNLDLAISQRSISIVSIRLGVGDGTFGPPVQTAVGSAPTATVTGDFNNDGHPDIATSNSGTSELSLLLGDGTGAFPVATAIPISQGSGAWGLVAADLNGDGNLDLTTANRGSGNISVMFGNGAGDFGSATVYTTGALATTIVTTDFNGDGKLDLATANEGSNSVTVHFNDGMGAFPAAVALSTGVQPFFVATGDLDTDGRADIVATNQGSNNVSVFRGNGDGTFAARMDFAVNAGPRSLVVADLNNDGSPDLSTGVDSGAIAVMLNGCSQNSAPTIASGTITRQQDAGSSNSTIATVGDAEDKLIELSVTVNGGSSASVNGVTVSNMTVDSAGNVTADVSAACGADDAMFSLVVTDSGGLSATATMSVDVIDESTPPVINNGDPIPNMTVYLPLHSPDVSVPVTFNLPAASDNCTLAPTVTSSPKSGATFGVGTTTVTVTAADESGNSATTTFDVTVLFNFSGLLQPIDPFPALNIARAGSSIPVKFSLSGNKGLDILAAGSPSSSTTPCDGNEPGTTIEETVREGEATLTYDPVSDEYKYVWRTNREWKKTCRILTVRLTDGSEHYAKFRFK